MKYLRNVPIHKDDLLLVTDSDCDRVGIAEHWGQTP